MKPETPHHILLAEDNPADVMLVREALRAGAIQCSLHVIADGDEVISYIEGFETSDSAPALDLVLLDMHLPRRDGDEILKHLRASARNAQTPVIVMTGSDSPEVKTNAEKRGPLYYFRKPSDLASFVKIADIVRNVLEGRTAQPGGAA